MYWMNIIRKSGRTELVINIKDLPADMQSALTASGMGSQDIGILGAFHSETKNVYIFLPEFARYLRAQKPNLDLSSPRAERLIINKLLNTIEHENLHLVMDKDIQEFAEEMTDEFIDQVVMPNTVEFLMTLDNPKIAMMAEMTIHTLTPMVRDMLKDTGQQLIHELMVRMIMQYDNKRIIDELTPYLRRYISLLLNHIGGLHGGLRMMTDGDTQNMIDGLMGLFLNAVPNFWANLMKELFLRNDELIGSFIQWNVDAVMNA